MENVQDLNNRQVPFVTIDPELEQYRDVVLFPEKLACVEQMLKTARLPEGVRQPATGETVRISGQQ